MIRSDPRLVKLFKNNEIIVYLVDGEVVRRDFNREFVSGGNSGRYPAFIPECDIWVESTLNDKDKLFNAAHEIVERYLMLWNNIDYNRAHRKASKFEAAIRRSIKSVGDPIKFAVDVTHLCKINWWLRNKENNNGLWPAIICGGSKQKVDIESLTSKIYCPICGKIMWRLKNGIEYKFPGFFDFHTISEDIKDWLSEDMKKWFKERTAKHISLVRKYCEKIEKYDPERFTGLIERGKEHDSLKYEETERDPYILISWDYKIGKGKIRWPRHIKKAMNKATEHHIKISKHHPESWSPRKTVLLNNEDRDKAPEEMADATRMDILSLAELVSDWSSMGEELGTDVIKWAKDNINKRWKFTKGQEELIYELINVGIG